MITLVRACHTEKRPYNGAMSKTHYTGHLSVRFPQEVLNRLDAVSGDLGRAHFVRQLIMDAIEDRERKAAKPKAAEKPRAKTKAEAIDEFADHIRQFYDWHGQDLTPGGLTLEEYAESIITTNSTDKVYEAWAKQGFTPS